MRNLSELIIDTTIQTSKQSPKITLFLSAAVGFLLPRSHVRPRSKPVTTHGEPGHQRCNDYYCEMC